MSRAALLEGVIALHQHRDDLLARLGPRPAWFHPFARRRWDHDRTRIAELESRVAAFTDEVFAS